jgi:hypothetical protein
MEARKDIVYTALNVNDTGKLLEKFPPKHTDHHGSHITLAFLSKKADSIKIEALNELGEIGKQTSIRVMGRAYDSKGDALLIERPSFYKILNKFPHITISTANVPPKYSNEMIENHAAEISKSLYAKESIAVGDFVFEPFSDNVNVTAVVVMPKNRIVQAPTNWSGGSKTRRRRLTRRR